MDLIKRRRSIRRYTAEAVADQLVRLLLEGAMAAPSGHDLRPCHFVVVRDREIRESLAATHEFSSMLAEAPVAIVICADETRSIHWLEDSCLAAENLLLAAVDLGLGAVWVAVYPHQQHERFVQSILEMPAHVRVTSIISVGHPAEEKPPCTRYYESRVHYDRFGVSSRPSDILGNGPGSDAV